MNAPGVTHIHRRWTVFVSGETCGSTESIGTSPSIIEITPAPEEVGGVDHSCAGCRIGDYLIAFCFLALIRLCQVRSCWDWSHWREKTTGLLNMSKGTRLETGQWSGTSNEVSQNAKLRTFGTLSRPPSVEGGSIDGSVGSSLRGDS